MTEQRLRAVERKERWRKNRNKLNKDQDTEQNIIEDTLKEQRGK